MSNLPVGKPEVPNDDNKFVPGLDNRPKSKHLGDTTRWEEFNKEAKVSKNKSSQYHDLTAGSGLGFNRATKDASLAAMHDRVREGQVINHWTGNQKNVSEHTRGNIGVTAYNGNPIEQTFKPATSKSEPPPYPVIFKIGKKDE